jgi:hypothetical protein
MYSIEESRHFQVAFLTGVVGQTKTEAVSHTRLGTRTRDEKLTTPSCIAIQSV